MKLGVPGLHVDLDPLDERLNHFTSRRGRKRRDVGGGHGLHPLLQPRDDVRGVDSGSLLGPLLFRDLLIKLVPLDSKLREDLLDIHPIFGDT